LPSIDHLADRLSTYLGKDQVNLVRRAYFYAEQAHDGQRRRSGEAYVTHPLAVANILADMHMDHQSLMAAMLHDVIEDTGIAKEALCAQFGETVAELVDGVSKLTQMNFETKAEAQAENFQKMAMAMARDIRVILVKLADRLHNMRTLEVLSGEKRRRIAKETLEIYAPIANRLGMHSIRIEFEDLGFKAMYPMRSSRIGQAVKRARGNRKELVNKIEESLSHCLAVDAIEGEVSGRQKHLYGIYKKMRGKRRAFNEIMDVYAFRIIVDKVDTCYRVLGAVHNLYKPLPGRFKDYIAIPKANGYQSLHTTLFGMHGVPIEIQIRTREMEEMANNGIAAHWLYKSSGDEQPKGTHARARQWVKGVLEMQQRAGNSLEFIESVKIDLFPDEVYVFTPKGRRWQQLHRMSDQSSLGTALRTVAKWLYGRDRQRAWRTSESGMAQFRGHRQGPHPYSPRAQTAAPLRVHQPWRTPAEQGTQRFRQYAGEDPGRPRADDPHRVPSGGHRRPA
jgi:GTP diphosphokinase / guanosine-3',5'-bis(diphosphate) 3'-diphosphatase